MPPPWRVLALLRTLGAVEGESRREKDIDLAGCGLGGVDASTVVPFMTVVFVYSER